MTQAANRKIIVAISGGVDSAVAALRLIQAGRRVEGLYMTNWDDDDGYCTAAQDYQDARMVCAELDIPLHHVNFAAEYRAQVFTDFLAEYAAGRTPNPDVLCNREIKFGAFLKYARRLGADAIATGHYARIDHRNGPRLLKGADPQKDQSYFLHAVARDALVATLFPLGDLSKRDVRRLAMEAGLPVHDKRDSTGICFIGERPFREFLGRYLPATPGPILTPDGETVGEHAGLMYYTLGQRQGLGIGGRAGSDGEPWYVATKDCDRNALIVVQGRSHRLLWSAGLRAVQTRWIAGLPTELQRGDPLRCGVKTRYRQPDADGVLRATGDGTIEVQFDRPQWAVAPGQYAVFYRGDECLGGGAIEAAATVTDELTLPAAATA